MDVEEDALCDPTRRLYHHTVLTVLILVIDAEIGLLSCCWWLFDDPEY